MTSDRAGTSKAKIIVSGSKGAGFRVQVYDENGGLSPWGEFEAADHSTALGIAQRASDCGRVPVLDGAASPEHRPSIAAAPPNVPPVTMQKVRRAPRRRKSAEGSAATDIQGAWSELTDRLIESVDPAEAIKAVSEQLRASTAEGVSQGKGGAVLYSQATHQAFIQALVVLTLQSSLQTKLAGALFRRIHELEGVVKAKTPLEYRGVFRTGEEYAPGTFVTHDGSMWHANQKTSGAPGGGSRDWTLCVKRGRDGKDLK